MESETKTPSDELGDILKAAQADGDVTRLLGKFMERYMQQQEDHEHAMARYLDKLIDDAGGDAVPAQLCFKPGVTQLAGALARGAIAGTYKLGVMSLATKDTPGNFKPGERVLINITFVPDAVLQVITFMETSGLVMADASGALRNPFGVA
jgi:hypothetical protein